MKTQMMPVGDLIPYERNAKLHPESQIKKLAEIIREFGFRQPILVDRDMIICSGHGRLQAAKLLGMTEVPVNIADDLTPKQMRAYRIADNMIAETDWDNEQLNSELKIIEQEDAALLEFLGIEEKELEERLKDEGKKQVSFDAKELSEDEFQEFDHECPKCGFHYDD